MSERNHQRLSVATLLISLTTLVLVVLQLVRPAIGPGTATAPGVPPVPSAQISGAPGLDPALLATPAARAATPTPLAPGIGANAAIPAYTAPYRYGINLGYREGWNNNGLAVIAGQAGATSARIKLPEWLFDQYGYDSEFKNNDMQAYRKAGMLDLTAFLIGPIRAHSNAPADKSTDTYSPKNLYEPIWLAEGRVNPENYWAAYVFNTVSTYKGEVRIWEAWNEPDLVYEWKVTQDEWYRRPPRPDELLLWNDTIFAYIRLLRITYEVAKYVDPTCFVAPGGLGYESFLHGILRYTDNPQGGAVTPEYPARGGAYFDVMSFHHYPYYAIQDLETNRWYRNTDSDAAFDSFALKIKNLKRQLTQAGYDGKIYPEKWWICTETGVPIKRVGDHAGGPELMRNFLVKLALVAQAEGIKQVHWYVLTDQESRDAATNWTAHMGLYYDVKGVKPGSQELKPPAASYATTTRLLDGKRLDGAASAALRLPETARGYVFTDAAGRKTFVLWARTANDSETAAAQVTLQDTGPLLRYETNYALDGAVTRLAPGGGGLTVALTGTPIFLVEAAPE